MERKTALPIVLALAGIGAAIAVGFSQSASESPKTGSMASLRGVVSDDTGKPVRGATVTATSGSKSVSRFTDQSGRYSIAELKPGQYEVSVAAWGFGPQKSTQEISKELKIIKASYAYADVVAPMARE